MEGGCADCRVDGSFLSLAAASDLLCDPGQLLYFALPDFLSVIWT